MSPADANRGYDCRLMTRAILGVLLTISVAALSAAELTVMSAGALEAGMMQLADEFGGAAGHTVRVEIGNAPQLAARLAAGDAADILVAPANVMDQAVAGGRVVAASRTTVGRVGVAIVVRAKAPAPDVSSADALRRALVAADAVIYNQGSSGTYIETMLRDLGIADRIRSKSVRVLNGEAVTERIVSARGSEIAFVAITDAVRGSGLRYVGPLPPPLQNFTTYDAAVMSKAKEPAAAAEFLRFMTTPDAKRALLAAGVE
jgi:molybdate transport system substrate-binding protein